jgi:hypothetical protein
MSNGDLLTAAETSFDVLITTDQKSSLSTEFIRPTAANLGASNHQLAKTEKTSLADRRRSFDIARREYRELSL